MTRKTVLFSVELPFGNGSSQDYSSSLQLFFPNDPRQSLLDHPVIAKSPPGIAVDFQPIPSKENSGRSTRVFIRHLCSSYVEVKAVVYKDLISKVGRLPRRKFASLSLVDSVVHRKSSLASNVTSTKMRHLCSTLHRDNVRCCSTNFNQNRTIRYRFVPHVPSLFRPPRPTFSTIELVSFHFKPPSAHLTMSHSISSSIIRTTHSHGLCRTAAIHWHRRLIWALAITLNCCQSKFVYSLNDRRCRWPFDTDWVWHPRSNAVERALKICRWSGTSHLTSNQQRRSKSRRSSCLWAIVESICLVLIGCQLSRSK